jgi:hypothetical protein
MFEGREVDAEDERLLAIRSRLRKEARRAARAEARRIRLLAEASEIAQARTARLTNGNSREREMAIRSIALEFGAAVRTSDRTMQRRMGDAEQLLRLFPSTVDALAAARIDAGHAAAILDTGCVINDDDVRAAFEKVVLDKAATDTPARTRAFARQLAERFNPRTIDERFAAANEDRTVTVTELDDGMAELRALLPAAVAFGIFDRLTQQAKKVQQRNAAARRERAADQGDVEAGAGETAPIAVEAGADAIVDERSRNHIRADLFSDLLLTGTPYIDVKGETIPNGLGAIRAQVQITVPVTTLTGVTTGGGQLDGRSPVDSATACRLAGNAPGWDRVMTDPVRGTVIDVDKYNPLASQQRFLDARDVHCRGLGCRQPVRRSQLDHNLEYHEGGSTSIHNLCHLCVRHHTLKTETAWTVTQLPGGTLEFTSPLGFTYRDDPPTRVVFLPDAPF